MSAPDPRICVFAPNLMVTVTIEDGPGGGPEVHFHAGGQGFWIARMVAGLGESAVLCAPIGGEPGTVVRALLASTDIEIAAVGVERDTPAYVHDRRGGDRLELVRTSGVTLSRHDIDALYGAALGQLVSCEVGVVTGCDDRDSMTPDFYRRLGSDLAAAGARVVADMHGEPLSAFLAGGGVEILKVSDEDLASDGVRGTEDEGALREAITDLSRRGVENVVVSRSRAASLGYFDGSWYSVGGIELREVDHRGSGDSMTAGLAVGLLRGLDPEGLLRLGSAAGAANVTRHGLGSADVCLVAPLAERVEVSSVDGPERPDR